jgi:predicted dinucleotide-binding enzyme
MKIGIIGTGKIGGTLARLLAGARHEVALASSRGPASLASLVEELGPRARAGTLEEAASFGDLVVVTIPLRRRLELHAEPFRGKIVIDTGNYYRAATGHRPR